MNQKDRREILKHVRNLCPKKGSSIASITITSSVNGVTKEVVTLTAEDRDRINQTLKKMKGIKDPP